MLVKTSRGTAYWDRDKSQTCTRPMGTKIEHRHAYMICILGVAEPLDEECFVELEKRNWRGLLRFSKRRKQLADSEQSDSEQSDSEQSDSEQSDSEQSDSEHR